MNRKEFNRDQFPEIMNKTEVSYYLLRREDTRLVTELCNARDNFGRKKYSIMPHSLFGGKEYYLRIEADETLRQISKEGKEMIKSRTMV